MTAYNFTLVDSASPWTPGLEYTAVGTFALTGALASGDTITAANIIPGNGVEIKEIIVSHPRLDSNATPTGTYNLGDGTTAAAFIASGNMGGVNAGVNMSNTINVAPSTTTGAGMIYNNATNVVLTVNAALATAVTTGLVTLKVVYRCVGRK